MIKNIEVKTIDHKGVKVIIEINHDRGHASIVEIVNEAHNATKPKTWVFSNRGLEYMNGWLIIIEAMKIAVEQIKKDLEQDLADKSKFKTREEKFILKGDLVRIDKRNK